MSKVNRTSRGITWTLGGQLITSVGQFLYSGITARIFTPAEFGGFAAALSLMGVLTLLTTTGLPSYVLKEPVLSRQQVQRLRTLAVVGGLATTGIFVLVSPFWLMVLNAQEGYAYLPLLAAGQALGPISAVESALLRREMQPARDSTSLVLAFLLANGCGLLFALFFGQAWTLALALVLQPLFLTLAARFLQQVQPQQGEQLDYGLVFGFTRRITLQNVGFLLLQKMPEWTMSSVLGAAALGNFSKGSSLSQMPSTALSAALNRVVQPRWRFFTETDLADKASRDAGLLAAAVSFPVFGFVAFNATTIVALWLGEGWDEAGVLASYVAIAAALSVPFGVLANSLEMRGNFRPVRIAQVWMLLATVPPLALLILTRDVRWGAGALVSSQLVALVIVAIWPSTARTRLKLGRQLLSLALWTTAISASGFAAATQLPEFGREDHVIAQLTALSVAGAVSVFLWLATFRWHGTTRVLQRRGFKIPKLLEGKARSDSFDSGSPQSNS